MKKKLFIKTLLPITLVPFASCILTSCSNNNQKEELYIEGKVTDNEGNKLADVNVSTNGKTIKTDKDGNYRIDLNKQSDVVYFEKYGYIGEAFGSYNEQVHKNHKVDIILYPYALGTDVTITGNVKNMSGELMTNCSITFEPDSLLYKRQVITDNTGNYSVNLRVAPNTTNVTYVVNNANCDNSTHILTLDGQKQSYTNDIVVAPYQYDFTAFVSDEGDNKIIMHVYRNYDYENDKGTIIKLSSNFSQAFENEREYTLTFNVSQDISRPNTLDKLDDTDFSITFEKYDDTLQVRKTVNLTEEQKSAIKLISPDKWNFNIFLPSSQFSFKDDQENDLTFGIHLSSNANGKFAPYGHKEYGTESTNELCYIRVDKNNAMYSATDNVNPFGLTWDMDTTQTNWKIVGSKLNGQDSWELGGKYNYGCQIRIAKYYDAADTNHQNGIYIMTKYSQDQMGDYLLDSYRPNFFIDPVQLENGKFPSREVDNKIRHLCPASGYALQSYDVVQKRPYENEKQYNQIFDYTNKHLDDSVKFYSEKDLMITYIPFSYLDYEDENNATVSFTNDSTFGFACNLQYPLTTWYKWQGSNPSGYTNIPHFEETKSYIQFDKDLNIIPYTE